MSLNLANLLFSPRGRIAPTHYWIGFSHLSALSIAVLLVPRVGWVLWLATLVPWTCIGAKRLHDLGHSAWLLLAPVGVNAGLITLGVSLIGWSLISPWFWPQSDWPATSLPAVTGALLLIAGVGMFNIVWWVWLGLTQGEDGDNRFGPPPRIAGVEGRHFL